MEMCSESMCININSAECSGARGIICATDIYAVTRNELAVTLPSWEKLIKLPGGFYAEETGSGGFSDHLPKTAAGNQNAQSFALFGTHIWETLCTSVTQLGVTVPCLGVMEFNCSWNSVRHDAKKVRWALLERGTGRRTLARRLAWADRKSMVL